MSSTTRETCVATFHATYAVLKAEKLLKAAGVAVRMIPVPRQISSNCGISIRFSCLHLDSVRETVTSLSEDLEGFFRLEDDGTYRRL